MYTKIKKRYNIIIILIEILKFGHKEKYWQGCEKIKMENSIMITFFIGTIWAMLSLSGIIFLIYCFTYEMKNKKKLYKESKILAGIGIIIGIIMITLSILYFYKNI